MKSLMILMVLVFSVLGIFGADTSTVTNDSESVQQEKLFQRFLKEMRGDKSITPTNFDYSFMTNYDTPHFREYFFKVVVVHPSFGLYWDEVPPPTMTGTSAMAKVEAFVATNGWFMQTNGGVFDTFGHKKSKPFSGLPWTVIHEREFRAVTQNGILYVLLKGWHHDWDGVAYNPHTNVFSQSIRGFKPIGQHWYVWARREFPVELAREYEGETTTEKVVPTNAVTK